MASEEENVDDDDGQQMPAYTISSLMSLRLRGAKNRGAFEGKALYFCRGGGDWLFFQSSGWLLS